MIWLNSTLYTDRDEILHEVVLLRSEPATIPKYQLDCLSNSFSEFHEVLKEMEYSVCDSQKLR